MESGGWKWQDIFPIKNFDTEPLKIAPNKESRKNISVPSRQMVFIFHMNTWNISENSYTWWTFSYIHAKKDSCPSKRSTHNIISSMNNFCILQYIARFTCSVYNDLWDVLSWYEYFHTHKAFAVFSCVLKMNLEYICLMCHIDFLCCTSWNQKRMNIVAIRV